MGRMNCVRCGVQHNNNDGSIEENLCPECRKEVKRQIEAGIFPNGLSEEAKKRFHLNSYVRLKTIEVETRRQKPKSPEDAERLKREGMKKYQDAIAKLNRDAEFSAIHEEKNRKEEKYMSYMQDFKLPL